MKKACLALCLFWMLLAGEVLAEGSPYPTPALPYQVLDTTKIISVKIGEAVTTTAPSYAVAYADVQETLWTSGNAFGSFTTSYASAVAAPSAGKRNISSITICNLDTVSHTIYCNISPTGTPATITAGLLNNYSLAAGATITLTNSGSTVTAAGAPAGMSVVYAPSAGPVKLAGPTAARTITVPDANSTMARTDAGQTFTGTQTFNTAIAIGSGGTNSGTALGGNRPIVSSGSAIVETSGYLRKTGAYTVNTTTDCNAVIDCDTTAGGANATIAVSLPAASSVGLGFRVTIVNSGTVASGTAVHTVTVAPNGADCIDGTAVTHTLNAQYSKMVLVSTGVAGAGTGKGWVVETAEDWLSSGLQTIINQTFSTPASITSIALTPGEWDLCANMEYASGGTGVNAIIMSISSTNNVQSGAVGDSESIVATSTTTTTANVPQVRVQVTASSQTWYVIGQVNASSGTNISMSGRISARRVR